MIAKKEFAEKKKPNDHNFQLDRREFLKKAGLAVGSLILAGSLGTVIGCSTETADSENSGYAPGSTAPEKSNSSNTADGSSASGTDVNCRFNNNGTCSKTGQPCTNCIEAH